MTAEQLDIFGWVDEGKAQPEQPKIRPKKLKPKPKPKPKPKQEKPVETNPGPKKVKLKLKTGEVAYQCMECDDEPTIYDRIKPMAKCPICNVLLEVIEEKIPEIKTEATKGWL